MKDWAQHTNVPEDQIALLAAYITAAFVPEIPHPILGLFGEQGTGKTITARRISACIDPSPAQTRGSPQSAEKWAPVAAGSYVVALDNISSVPAWLSDVLCRAVTGEGFVTRKLYTDADLYVACFRRILIMNGIDLGALRGDLADRLLVMELRRIPDNERRPDDELDRAWEAALPGLLGAQLDLVAGVLRELPNIRLRFMPRMAAFARVCAAVDRILGSDTLDEYRRQHEGLAADVVEDDAVGVALIELLEDEDGCWEGTASQLLKAITPEERQPREWPESARAMAGRLKRLAPSLRAAGVEVENPARRVWRLTRTEGK